MIKFEDLTCVCTCSACPEQYDVLYKGQIVGSIQVQRLVTSVDM